MPHRVDPSTVTAFERDGAVVLRGLLTATEVNQLAQGIEHNLAHPSPLKLIASQADDPGRFVEDFCTWQNNPFYREVMCQSALPQVAAELMQSQSVRLYHDHLLVKEPGTRQPTPWHQDQPYYNVSGRQNVSFWIPVDPVPLESTLRLVAGSHTGTWYMPRTFRDQQAKWFPQGSLAELPDIDGNIGANIGTDSGTNSDPDIGSKTGDGTTPVNQLAWALQPGDAVAFHMLSLHASSGTGPQGRRRVFSARYLGDDARHAIRPWRTSPPFEGLQNRLPDGALMDDALFPLVWPLCKFAGIRQTDLAQRPGHLDRGFPPN